ncbi:DUF4248 domain-containing protein [Bacteroides sp.]|uniref:DUF4248 domain-containing protein n=1 Tax=Bacteroides sp. TaxID=29523 RepID=UPI00345D529D
MIEEPSQQLRHSLPHYTFTELAQAYFPGTSKQSTARKNLHNWIGRVPKLKEQLSASGFDPLSRVELPPRVVAFIFAAFDEP